MIIVAIRLVSVKVNSGMRLLRKEKEGATSLDRTPWLIERIIAWFSYCAIASLVSSCSATAVSYGT